MKKFSLFFIISSMLMLVACSDNFQEISSRQDKKKIEKSASGNTTYTAAMLQIKKINDTIFFC